MRAYRRQILSYLNDYDKPRTGDDIIGYIASRKGLTLDDVSDRRRRTIMSCLRKMEAEGYVLSKKDKKGNTYWSTKSEVLARLDDTVAKVPLKDLLKKAKASHKPIKFYRG